MNQNSDQPCKPKLPKKDAGKRLRERWAQQRRENFRNIIRRQPLIEFYRTTPLSSDELETIGIQWCTGIGRPSWLHGYPDQFYWQTFSLIFMFRDTRWFLTVRGKKMPYRNYEQYAEWIKDSRD